MERSPSYIAAASSTSLDGLYGAGYYTSSLPGAIKEAERKGRRKGRQIRPSPVPIPGASKSHSYKGAGVAVNEEGIRSAKRAEYNTDVEKRYLDQLRMLELDSPAQSWPSTSAPLPAMGAVENQPSMYVA